jgi:hypothetical protein
MSGTISRLKSIQFYCGRRAVYTVSRIFLRERQPRPLWRISAPIGWIAAWRVWLDRLGLSRYADDLAFSGGEEFALGVDRFSTHVAAVVAEEGFAANHRKTRIMRQGVRQQLTGLIVNQRMNIRRVDFDRLKATLTNCVHFGPASQNREGHPSFEEHMEGRLGFVEMVNPEKARRLRRLWERIVWP